MADAFVLLIDNYDSFVFNLARYIEECGVQTLVVRNDALTISEVKEMAPSAIVLSPGPGHPQDAGVCEEIVSEFSSSIPILGVCLGHQAIVTALGGTVVRADEPRHGRTSSISHSGTILFEHCASPLQVTRYHSLIADESTLPSGLSITARTDDSTIMAIQHDQWNVFGVQFHPESILTQAGHQLICNFLNIAGIEGRVPDDTERQMPSEPSEPDFYAMPIEPEAHRPL